MAFCSLALVALALIGVAVNDAMRFAAQKDGLVSTWESAPAVRQVVFESPWLDGMLARANTNRILTNQTQGAISQPRLLPHG
jgi:hypothetical protein